MNDRRPSAAASDDTSSVYSAQTLPPPPPVAETARASQSSFASRAWIFGKVPSYHNSQRRPHLDPVAIRESVAYPSASSFEATIEKGTARCGRRNSTKPQLVDLGGLRRTVKRMTTIRRGSEQRSAVGVGAGATPGTLREAFGQAGGVEVRREEEVARPQTQTDTQTQAETQRRSGERVSQTITFSPPTDLQLATMMYHETQNDIVSRTRTESPTSRVPEMPFRDKIRGKHFSRTTGNLEREVSSYAKYKNRGCTSSQCAVI
ncbi:uncharacterized protein GGS22DRAFT_193241 [Annulohypoxylon maeteangense]|uniref:uncharacterized protein n=1 Tax=Annulohypoxylon maeteangense TaxID=1927788 RepID=UPI00200734BF|nr:uncharacterized protein GGS22DRAFT_193241 [Annulohypoxylon maeteangense]KAI0880470.1 hypothetical protein GGS22DRAFT_193241 [Annulohypoxylon maeteangense]